jgi:hypothetical protein
VRTVGRGAWTIWTAAPGELAMWRGEMSVRVIWLLAVGITACAASADTYWYSFEASDGKLPEESGWTRYWGNKDGECHPTSPGGHAYAEYRESMPPSPMLTRSTAKACHPHPCLRGVPRKHATHCESMPPTAKACHPLRKHATHCESPPRHVIPCQLRSPGSPAHGCWAALAA